MRFDDVFAMVGRTPSVRVDAPDGDAGGAEIYAKLEGYNPTGSIKDRACVALIRDKLDRGELRPDSCLLDASSGNMACALAYFGRLLGYRTHLFSNSKLTDDKRSFIEYFDATLELEGSFTIEGNRACRRMAESEPGRYCFTDQLHNWANPQAHYETTGPEILETFPDVAMVVGSLGSGGSMYGVGKYMKERRPQTRVVVVESASGTKLPGTGAFVDGDYRTPFIEAGFAEEIFDDAVRIHLHEAQAATERLKSVGVFAGFQTGGVYHATRVAVERHEVRGPVVFLSGDSGWKNLVALRAAAEGPA